ncbi:BQ5605_C009g05430 [Microbotryum silenes-dioicae]|nr:BQ5605_C009g05430 [Microbotryum silenes-dioicae]
MEKIGSGSSRSRCWRITSALTTPSLVQAILEKASTSNRVLVVCGGSNAIIRTSPVQVASKDHCTDAVDLFPHAYTPKKVEAWKMDDATGKSWKGRIHDDQLMEDIYIVMRQGAQGE